MCLFSTLSHFSYLRFLIPCFIIISSFANESKAQVSVGNGTYSTILPSGEIGPQNFNGQDILPKVSDSFTQRVQTNDFWSSLIFPFFGNQYSGKLIAHPLTMQGNSSGLEIAYVPDHVSVNTPVGTDFLYPYNAQFTVGVSGMNSSNTETYGYDDWTVTAEWVDGDKSMLATLGHGLPFVFFEISGGDAAINFDGNPTVWFNENGVLGVTIEGRHYGIFAPSGSSWNSGSTYTSSLNGKDYLSIAILPDNSQSTLDEFKIRAYAFVTNSEVEWDYDESTSTVTSTYSYETTLKDSSEGNINETISALYRHQWIYVNEPLTNYSYASPRGEMKAITGNSFSTTLKFQGVLPALPNQGDYNPDVLKNLVSEVANESLQSGPTYENGKAMARFANLVHIADQLGLTTERDYFLSSLKTRLEEWFTVGGDQEYHYNSDWDVLTGYPSGFGADNQVNDHHFHASYAIVSAATIAQYDSAWAAQEQWGGMVNMLIRDANGWDRDDELFPFLRSYDIYAGHSWAAGHGDFEEGNNQESSSESMNYASAVVLWGEVTGQTEIRDMGIFLYATETTAVEQYWFDVDEEVFPEDYPHDAIGMVWGAKGVHATWFGGDPEFVHGINLLPITSGSLYLGRHPEHIVKNYNEVVEERGGQPEVWQDIFWQYLSMADPNQALTYYLADPNYEAFDGESKAHTMHWLYNMKRMGQVDTTVTADIPTYAVFKKGEASTYIAYNSGSNERLVSFSDGYSMRVPAGETLTETTDQTNPNAPVILLTANKTSGKSPLTIRFDATNSFDRNNLDLSFSWDFDGLGNSTAEDTSFTFTEVGTYSIKLTVTNTDDLISTDSVEVEVLPNGSAFGGAPVSIPGTIEAENYDEGGKGIAYYDVDDSNIGGPEAFRADEGVDISADGGSIHVYWIVAGEWIEYTFEVQEEGEYLIKPHFATVPGFGNFTLYVDNVDISGKKFVTGTGSFINFQAIEIAPVFLEEGVHIMRFEFDTDAGSETKNWLMSFNNIVVEKTSSVSNEGETSMPDEFSLSQNYPNPFNPSTQINFTLPEASLVTLEVVNMLGQKVATLLNDQKPAGRYSVNFDASKLASGVYFYTIKAGDFSHVRKMLLIK
ncbi:MAG: T9SS type A sorting domain-containing protein [Balneolaceae bacterium]|nr:T9SS type A sorting domain-containing protein [Balneolaceae bacterium]MBO6544962.1 T9SS type A sorting domain-containing protein [Balneolaceae bacterium]MBO6646358.1 T9SS type A sorting domain-containing protein [Balneolaceae bacterium]